MKTKTNGHGLITLIFNAYFLIQSLFTELIGLYNAEGMGIVLIKIGFRSGFIFLCENRKIEKACVFQLSQKGKWL